MALLKESLNSAGVMEPTVKTSSARVRMGSFEVDLRSGELHSLASDGAANKAVLREQPFQVLPMLVEREGKIVTRSEIKKRLWLNDTIVDHDHIINVAIRSRRSHNWNSRTVLATCLRIGTATPGFIGLRIGVKVLSSRDLAYSPVKRNSASQGPSVWTTSQ